MGRMGTATRGVLYYLRRYFEAHPDDRAPFRHFHKEKTGRTLHHGNLSRYLTRKDLPNMDTGITILQFLHERGELIPGAKGEGLFVYAHPEFLSAPARPAPRKAAGKKSGEK